MSVELEGSNAALDSGQSFIAEAIQAIFKEGSKRFPKLAEIADKALANPDDVDILLDVFQACLSSQYSKLILPALKTIVIIQEKGMFYAVCFALHN